MMADTGCQSLAGVKVMKHLGISSHDLIPVTMKRHAANDHGINIIGAIILRFSGKIVSGESLTTQQVTYVTDCIDKPFLSHEACTALGMISKNFPQIDSALLVLDISSSGHSSSPPPRDVCCSS